jgi:hypothetical protein
MPKGIREEKKKIIISNHKRGKLQEVYKRMPKETREEKKKIIVSNHKRGKLSCRPSEESNKKET